MNPNKLQRINELLELLVSEVRELNADHEEKEEEEDTRCRAEDDYGDKCYCPRCRQERGCAARVPPRDCPCYICHPES